MTNGGRANRTGNQLENFVEDALRRCGYVEFQGQKNQVFANRQAMNGKQYIKQIPVGKTIYDTQRKADFLIINSDKFAKGLIIECKWQQSPGSVDEKYPYLLFNILKTEVPTVVLLDGGGYKPAAKDWLVVRATDPMSKGLLLGVWSMSEFQTKINNGFLG